MNASRKLMKQDVVGHAIKNIWLTDWVTTPNCDDSANKSNNPELDIHVQRIYIELDSGIFFEIQPYIEDYPVADPQIMEIIPNFNELHLDQSTLSSNCVGFQIVEVLVTQYLASHCLLLNNKIIVYCDSWPPCWSYGPQFNRMNHEFLVDEKEFLTYWEGKQLCLKDYGL